MTSSLDSGEARRALFDRFKAVERLNPQWLAVFPGEEGLRLTFQGERAFVCHMGISLADRAEILLLWGNPPHLVLTAPRAIFHPNLAPGRPLTGLVSFYDRWAVAPNGEWVPAYLWNLLTFQLVDDASGSVVNRAALEWFRFMRQGRPFSHSRFAGPSPTPTAPAAEPQAFHIQARRAAPQVASAQPRLAVVTPQAAHRLERPSLPPSAASPPLATAAPQPDPDRWAASRREEPRAVPSAAVPSLIEPAAVPSPLGGRMKILTTRPYTLTEQPIPAHYLGAQLEPDGYEYRVAICIPQSLWNKIVDHARGDLRNERIGFMYGSAHIDNRTGQFWLDVSEVKAARPSHDTSTRVEVSLEEMARLHREVDVQFASRPDILKLGWFHTHPGLRIFLSGTDRDTQRASYRAPWQVALVIDPVNRHMGFFAGAAGRRVPASNIHIYADGAPKSAIPLAYRYINDRADDVQYLQPPHAAEGQFPLDKSLVPPPDPAPLPSPAAPRQKAIAPAVSGPPALAPQPPSSANGRWGWRKVALVGLLVVSLGLNGLAVAAWEQSRASQAQAQAQLEQHQLQLLNQVRATLISGALAPQTHQTLSLVLIEIIALAPNSPHAAEAYQLLGGIDLGLPPATLAPSTLPPASDTPAATATATPPPTEPSDSEPSDGPVFP